MLEWKSLSKFSKYEYAIVGLQEDHGDETSKFRNSLNSYGDYIYLNYNQHSNRNLDYTREEALKICLKDNAHFPQPNLRSLNEYNKRISDKRMV